ncbi:hypothetical protein SAMN04488005_1250 [Yoonia tamlensis]|uniref:4Fe-4S Wbl-type domain-containing protein n=1 Tax=Yoonia tamlensis TaxID=390270 RepID=A0A1I6G8N0_9RHOB|nr:hypothetical protein [Yoonia tamlensis]SFR38562.1 hypothetical protein SAMN04488005_1250 [Yoonia tamlensis]
MILRALLSLTVAFALCLVGFGHKPLAPAQDAQAAAYVLAGGSWSDLCGQSGDPRDETAAVCQACIIAKSCAFGAFAQSAFPLVVATGHVPRAPQGLARLSNIDQANAARAPPLS